jgi:hypothetical protein
MRALVPTHRISSPANADALRNQPDATGQLLAPLLDLAAKSDNLIAGSVGEFVAAGELYRIPRVLFMGPKGGGDTIRLAIFATICGDELEGAQALIEFLHEVDRAPALAKGYHIHAYPVCNPAGFADGSRNNASGVDLAGQFWRGSEEPEVYYLEREMGVHQFQGVISLHEIDSFHFHARTLSSILNESVVQPALNAARRFLPERTHVSDENVATRPNSFQSVPEGLLTRTDELPRSPFEINFGIPLRAPRNTRIQGAIAALKAILDCYRSLQAMRQNI